MRQRTDKVIAKNKYTQMAQDFCLSARRKNGRIVSYVTIFTTQQTDKKTSQVGIFFAGNRLITQSLIFAVEINDYETDNEQFLRVFVTAKMD